jgi:hypothetical protein
MKDKLLEITLRASRHADGFYATGYMLFSAPDDDTYHQVVLRAKTVDEMAHAIDQWIAGRPKPTGGTVVHGDDYNAWHVMATPSPRGTRWPAGFKAAFGRSWYLDWTTVDA